MFSIPLGFSNFGQVVAAIVGVIILAAVLEVIGHVIIRVVGKIMEGKK